MQRVNVDDLSCGMVLAEDVVSKNGRMLLAGGAVITTSQLRILRIWGVTSVAVADGREGMAVPPGDSNPADGGLAPRPEIPDAVRRLLDERFAIAGREQGAVAEIHQFCLRQYADAARCPPSPPATPPPIGQTDTVLPPAPESPQALLADEPSLASFPDIYFRLQAALNDPQASTGHIAGIVGTDPSLAASLLRLANSPLYGLSRPIDSLARGVMLIGADELAQLVLGVTVLDRFKDLPNACLTMRQAWEHAVGCGVLARVLACHVGGLVQETFFVAGLLHDIGRLVLLRRLPRHMARIMALAWTERMPLYAAELAVLGFTHAAVGEALLERWRLPPQLSEAVGGHHGGDVMSLDAAIVHVADAAAVAAGFGFNGSPLVPPVSALALDALALEPGVLSLALSQAGRQVGDIVSTLLAG